MISVESEIARIIQLAVAPVFLIAGVGAILGVVLNRLNILFRRYREFEASVFSDDSSALTEDEHAELQIVDRRLALMHRAIILLVLAILFIALVIVALFADAALHFPSAPFVVAGLFVAAMISLVAALGSFLMEVTIATRALRVRKGLLRRDASLARRRI